MSADHIDGRQGATGAQEAGGPVGPNARAQRSGMQRSGTLRPYAHRLRVRYEETDQMGVVYHANYLTWFEVARTEWIRSLGYPYRRLEQEGLLLPVLDVDAQYRYPARYDDEVEIEVELSACTPVRIGFSYVVRRVADGEVLVTGGSRHAWVNREWKPARLDKAMPELYDMLRGLRSGGEGR